jgi:gluconokinase
MLSSRGYPMPAEVNSGNFPVRKTAGFIVMGVSGCGKSTVGRMLAGRLGWDFFDGDDFHSPANIAKMRTGIPLTDEDRAPWLAALHNVLADTLRAGRHPVLACSALKERYRSSLRERIDGLRIVYLKGEFDLILARMQVRPGHYMKPGMLQSQFDALEEPADAWTFDVSLPPDTVTDILCQRLKNEA